MLSCQQSSGASSCNTVGRLMVIPGFVMGLAHSYAVDFCIFGPFASSPRFRLLLNMLIGVMCEVVSGVSQTEREVMTELFVREKVPVEGSYAARDPPKT